MHFAARWNLVMNYDINLHTLPIFVTSALLPSTGKLFQIAISSQTQTFKVVNVSTNGTYPFHKELILEH